jgi:acyl-CoA synthetase (NDP forming)
VDRLIKAVVDALVQVREAAKKPIVVVMHTPPLREATEYSLSVQEHCARQGFPLFPSIPRAANAIAKMVTWREMREDLAR